MSSLGQKIRKLRQERHLTQQTLGQGLVTASMISQIESDKTVPSLRLLEQLAKRLTVDSSYFTQEILDQTDLTLIYRRARALMESERYAEALPFFESLVVPLDATSVTQGIQLYFDTAQCYSKLDRLEEASRMYENCLKLAIEKQDMQTAIYSYYYLGHLHSRLNNPSLTRMYWQRASTLIQRYPTSSWTMAIKIETGLARTYLELKQYQQAKQTYNQAVAMAEQADALLDLADICDGLAKVLMRTGEYLSAQQWLERALHLYTSIHNQRGISYTYVQLATNLRLQKSYPDALKFLMNVLTEEAIHNDGPLVAQTYYEMAVCHLALKDYDQALALAQAVLRIQMNDSSLRVQTRLLQVRVFCLKNQHRLALSRVEKAYDEAARLNDLATLVEVQTVLQKVLLNLGMRRRALAAAKAMARLLQATT